MNSFAPWHSVGVIQTLKKLKTTSRGLFEREATKRLEHFGPNVVGVETHIPSFWRVVVRQWRNPFLLTVMIVSGIAWAMQYSSLALAFFILFIMYTIMGVMVDERQISVVTFLRSIIHSLSLIKRLQKPQSGAISQLRPISEVVPGDIVLLSTGDTVPADGRLLQSVDLQVDESMLTGESTPQEKQIKTLPATTSLLSRTNMVFSQSMVTRGNAMVAITATGKQTVVGSIGVEQYNIVKPATPLSQDLKRFYRGVMIAAACFTLGLFSIGLARGIAMRDLFPLIIIVSVAIIPQWLLSAVTVSFAEAARRLAGMGTMIKIPSSTDTLGRVTTLCIDKTATLTQGALSVESIIMSSGTVVPTSGLLFSHSTLDAQELWKAIILCNDARESTVMSRGRERTTFVGDSTDCAIAGTGNSVGIRREVLEKKFPRIRVFPFTTNTKWMSTIHMLRGSKPSFRLYCKGAPERVVELCSHRFDGALVKKFTPFDRSQVLHYIQRYSLQGYRVLGVARATYTSRARLPVTSSELDHLTWLGLVLLADPIRPESRLCIDELSRLGLRIVLVTGDHPVTAAMVGTALGLPSDRTILGSEVDRMNDGELSAAVNDASIFARIEPRGKERIVKALQRQGHVVAMTGDGINDAFALKHSDIGIAVANATDVAREAADIIVTSENLFSIHAALREGRRVVACIQVMVSFSLATMAAIATVLLGSLLFVTPQLLTPLHIVWLTLVVYLFPLLALLTDRELPYRFSTQSIGSARRTLVSVVIGVVLGMITLFVPLFRLPQPVDIVGIRTTVWMALSLLPLGLLLGGVSGRWARKNLRSHLSVALAIGLVSGLQFLTITDPWLRSVFDVERISLWNALAVMGGVGVMVAVRMIVEQIEQEALV